MRRHIVIVLAILGLAGCIVEFVPDINSDTGGIMVVDGTITDGETVISLSLSETLHSSKFEQGVTPEPRPVRDARVWVESEVGGSFSAVEIVDTLKSPRFGGGVSIQYVYTGQYRIDNGALDDNTRYRVRIESMGEEYVSGWRAPQASSIIEGIEIQGNDGMVQVRVDARGEADGQRNFMWNYEETWETRAPINSTEFYGRYEDEYKEWGFKIRDMLDAFSLNLSQFHYPGPVGWFYYCWTYQRNPQVLIADTKRLSENSLRDHVLLEFEDSNNRLSVLYHIRLNQYAIGDDAYLYLNTLRENTDNTGSIFAPVPSEMKGNLVCTTSPETYVIGFVEVSHVVTSEVFLNSADSPYRPLPLDCRPLPYAELEIEMPTDYGSYYLATGAFEGYTQDPLSMSTFTDNLRCIDCREGGGTKKRPDWWPNDHY